MSGRELKFKDMDEDLNWLEDKRGNRASVEHFGSREEAQKALDSCTNCTNCKNCKNCDARNASTVVFSWTMPTAGMPNVMLEREIERTNAMFDRLEFNIERAEKALLDHLVIQKQLLS